MSENEECKMISGGLVISMRPQVSVELNSFRRLRTEPAPPQFQIPFLISALWEWGHREGGMRLGQTGSYVEPTTVMARNSDSRGAKDD